MKSLSIVALLSSYIFAGVNVSYDSKNDAVSSLVAKLFGGVENISLNPASNEAKALYDLKTLSSPTMAICYSNTIDGIKAQGGSEKLDEYLMLTPLLKGQLHLIVRANAPFKSIHDLERHNVSMGLSGSALNLTSKTLFIDSNVGVSEFNYDLNEAMGRLLGGGVDAVVAIGNAPIEELKKYQGHFKLLNVASSGKKSTTIGADKYGLSGDVISVASDLILIAKKEVVTQNNLTPLASKITRKLISDKLSSVEAICSNNGGYSLSVSPTLSTTCTQYQNELISSGKKEVVITLDLLRQANSIEEIELYIDSLQSSQMIGGLSKDTELSKLQQVYNLLKKQKERSPNAKLMIKSYVGSTQSDGYENAQVIFKYLQKSGISRGDMIIKSFNQDTFCKDPKKQHCNFLNRKLLFEFIE